jgi:hypothetical protein
MDNLKEEVFIWAHSFKDFSLWSIGSIVYGPVVRLYFMVEEDGGAKLLNSCQSDSLERDRRSQEQNMTFKACQLPTSEHCIGDHTFKT